MEFTGVDESHHQGEINYDKFVEQGVDFNFGKSSDGLGSTDHTFDYNWSESKAHSIPFGGFHYVRSGIASSVQFETIKRSVGDRDMGMYALDCEDKYATPKAQTGIIVDLLRRLDGYYQLVLPVMIYTRAEWWRRIILDVGYPWQNHPLWIAQYKTKQPDVPAPWTFWTIWQYGQADGKLYGVKPLENKLIDVDIWNPAVAFPWAEVAPKVTVTGTITINGVDYQLTRKE